MSFSGISIWISVALGLLFLGRGEAADWLTKTGEIKEGLLKIQALIVKDQALDTKNPCKPKINLQQTYLICSGSVIGPKMVLTSATCVRHITEFRHNINGTLAVAISMFSNNSAMINPITESIIHPDHELDPKHENHHLHNLAIMKLRCKVKPKGLAVKLPTASFQDTCESDEACRLAILKMSGKLTFTIYEDGAKNIEGRRRKRSIKIFQNDKYYIHLSDLGSWNHMGFFNESELTESRFTKLLRKRFIGLKGCPLIGAPIMSDDIQAAAISEACDDRQPNDNWNYVDIYDNVDWINSVLGKTEAKNKSKSSCQTCVTNYFVRFDNSQLNNGTPSRIEPANNEISGAHDLATDRRSLLELKDPRLLRHFPEDPSKFYSGEKGIIPSKQQVHLAEDYTGLYEKLAREIAGSQNPTSSKNKYSLQRRMPKSVSENITA